MIGGWAGSRGRLPAALSGLLLTVVPAALAGSDRVGGGPAEGTMAERRIDMAATELLDIEPVLQAVEASGTLGGVVIECWFGGGQPPPYYRSDQIRLLRGEDGDSVQFATLAFAPFLDPPSVVLRFRIPASPADIREVARLLRTSGAFSDAPEAPASGGADMLSTELIVTSGDRRLERRFFEPLPANLVALRAKLRELTDRALRSGSGRLVHEGKTL